MADAAKEYQKIAKNYKGFREIHPILIEDEDYRLVRGAWGVLGQAFRRLHAEHVIDTQVESSKTVGDNYDYV